MTANPKKFRSMTPAHAAKYRRNVMRLHRGLMLVHAIGLISVGLFGIGLVAYHLALR
jgi:hypothetical protein